MLFGPRLLIALLLVAQTAFFAWEGDRFTPSLNAEPPAAIALTDAKLAGPLPPLEEGEPDRRVILFIVDGLRTDSVSSLELASGSGDRQPTAECELTTVWPSYSRPAYAALGTGAPPRLSGVGVNSHTGPVRLHSLFMRARQKGLKVALLTDGSDWWETLFPHVWVASSTSAETFGPLIGELLGAHGADLTLVHWVDADDMAHTHGARSRQYAESLAAAGVYIRALAEQLDPERDTLIVTADHGHIDRGGHGGDEAIVTRVPLIALGRGIAPDEDNCGLDPKLVDIAPTVAVLLGLSPLRHATGRPLWGLLDLSPEMQKMQALLVDRFQRGLAEELGQADGDLAAALGEPRGVEVTAAAIAGAGWLVWLALFVLASRTGRRAWSLPGAIRLGLVAAVYPAVVVGFYAGTEPGLSYSAVWERDPWLLRMTLFAIGAAIGRWSISRALIDWRKDRAGVTASWAWSGAVCALPGLLTIAAYGSLDGWPHGDPGAAFAVLVGCIVSAFGSALLLAEIGLTAALERWRPAPPTAPNAA